MVCRDFLSVRFADVDAHLDRDPSQAPTTWMRSGQWSERGIRGI